MAYIVLNLHLHYTGLAQVSTLHAIVSQLQSFSAMIYSKSGMGMATVVLKEGLQLMLQPVASILLPRRSTWSPL
jgi:hypothetical protein